MHVVHSLVEDEIEGVLQRLKIAGIDVLEGNKVVKRTGAQVLPSSSL